MQFQITAKRLQSALEIIAKTDDTQLRQEAKLSLG